MKIYTLALVLCAIPCLLLSLYTADAKIMKYTMQCDEDVRPICKHAPKGFKFNNGCRDCECFRGKGLCKHKPCKRYFPTIMKAYKYQKKICSILFVKNILRLFKLLANRHRNLKGNKVPLGLLKLFKKIKGLNRRNKRKHLEKRPHINKAKNFQMRRHKMKGFKTHQRHNNVNKFIRNKRFKKERFRERKGLKLFNARKRINNKNKLRKLKQIMNQIKRIKHIKQIKQSRKHGIKGHARGSKMFLRGMLDRKRFEQNIKLNKAKMFNTGKHGINRLKGMKGFRKRKHGRKHGKNNRRKHEKNSRRKHGKNSRRKHGKNSRRKHGKNKLKKLFSKQNLFNQLMPPKHDSFKSLFNWPAETKSSMKAIDSEDYSEGDENNSGKSSSEQSYNSGMETSDESNPTSSKVNAKEEKKLVFDNSDLEKTPQRATSVSSDNLSDYFNF